MRETGTYKRSVVFSNPQRIYLECESKRLGISVGELIRRIIDEARSGFNNPDWSIKGRIPKIIQK